MRIVTQRVGWAKLAVDNIPYSEIGMGLMCLVGIEDADTDEDIEWLAQKLVKMRIFDDENGVMNLDVTQVAGQVMIVSQFTLHASTKKGNRPSYLRASKEPFARPMYHKFIDRVEQLLGKSVATGLFGGDMAIQLCNIGPTTIIIDSKLRE